MRPESRALAWILYHQATAQLTRTQFSTENGVRGHLGSGNAPPCARLGGAWARGAGGQNGLPPTSESLSGCWGLPPRETGELVSGSPATLVQGYSMLWVPSLA